MFKIGDMITGNMNNHMGITNGDAVMEVTEVTTLATGGEQLSVRILGTRLGSKYIGKEYGSLDASLFMKAPIALIDEVVPKKKEKPSVNVDFKGGLKIQVFSDHIKSSFNPERILTPERDEARVAALQTILMERKKDPKNFNLRQFVLKENACEVLRDLFDGKELKEAAKKCIDFFKEFQKEPSPRMVNTITHITASGNDGIEYLGNYFKLSNDSHAPEIIEKIKSPEFKAITNIFALNESDKVVNKRIKIYFGSVGTGKTTQAKKEAEDRCIVCNNSMSPDDLMRDFEFDEGNPAFHKSSLRRCMEEGLKIVFDEINLLPFESLRFLQGLTDNKESFLYHDTEIKIKEGFQIIGTMNLTVNSMVFGLPEPIVDRCSEIKEFKMTPDMLIEGAF